ncbi:hypothetical protein [Crassaminicella profunda]|uniref:hypothetical protein n=1 Tax=Crassaminicella profunda TaxID=1286698 RepID=UPI001CA79663|nr:hypothetical protein [Crassaminicella profunda]QZY54587.1 hypothetical protein K7H06_16325 [Crassaminicella profunda]
MRKYLLLIVLSLILLCTGCVKKEIKGEIQDFVQKQERSVNEKDLESYMNTISKEESQYLAEKKSWMRDIQENKIEDYTLNVEKIKILDTAKVCLNLRQSYQYEGKKYNIEFPLVLVKEDDQWKDHDLLFDEIDTQHFKIKYLKNLEKYAMYIKSACEDAYENVQKRYGEKIEGYTTIKLYEDKELLRQSVKLSFSWQFGGWYEYPESIKTTEFKNEETYRKILEHELIHKITIKKSNNNMPYWFTEGLAVYFANFPNELKDYQTKEYYLNTYKDYKIDILKLEKANLEKMEDSKSINCYYDSAGMIVKFMVETYGLEKVKKIVEELGKFPYDEGTGSEVNEKSIERFHLVVERILGMSVEELNKEWVQFIYETE